MHASATGLQPSLFILGLRSGIIFAIVITLVVHVFTVGSILDILVQVLLFM